jgi:hypothetical protein
LDSEALRQTYEEINARSCVFEKGLLTHQCACSEAERFCIAEREGVRCGSAQAHETCLAFIELLRKQARFALKTGDEQRALPHAKAMRLKIGGLRGVAVALAPDQPTPSLIADVRALLLAAIARFGDLARLPFPLIMREIAAYKLRRRRPDPGSRGPRVGQ